MRAGRIRETKQAAAERGHQEAATPIGNDAPARQREADARIEAEGLRRAELPHDPGMVGDPHVARVILDQAVDVSGRAVDEVELWAIEAVQTPRRSDPHSAGAILIDAEGLLAVVTVGLGHARPAVSGIAEQPGDGCGPHRAATI